MKILDATCGQRGIWYQKNHPLVTWMDERKGKFTSCQRTYNINPDVVSTWDNMPFPDNEFDMIVFDPPHIICNTESGDMIIRYGHLNKDTWRQTLQNAFKNLFRVLKPCGILILKWCESNISIKEIIKLSPYKPLFSNKSIEHNPKDKDTYMVIFLKYDVNKKLNIN